MKWDGILFIKEILQKSAFPVTTGNWEPMVLVYGVHFWYTFFGIHFLVMAASPPWACLCPVSAVIYLPITHETFSQLFAVRLEGDWICSLPGTNSITSVEALIPNLLPIGQPAQLPDCNTFITSLVTTSSVKITIRSLCFLSSKQLQSQQVLFFMTLSLAMLLPLLLVLKEMLYSWTASSSPKTFKCVWCMEKVHSWPNLKNLSKSNKSSKF